ncbi:MAG: peptidylprolyl isomerase [Polyangiaceae bacterium]
MNGRPLFLCSTLFLLAACANLTEPGPGGERGSGAAPIQAVTAAAVGNAPPAVPDNAPAAPNAPDRVRASHVLVAYQGARRSQATRSKDEARKLAEAVLARAKAGADFADLARQHSDDSSAKAKGGDLGAFQREMMVKPFADAAFALKPGEVSGIVETEFGFHVIRRTE